MRKIVISAVLMVMSALSGAAGAASTRYYSRQPLANMAKITYAGTYGAYGACSNGTKSATLVSCKSSVGATVANSYCAPTQTQACTITCGTLTAYNYVSGSAFAIGSAGSAAAAQGVCNAYVAAHPTPGGCGWYQGTVSYMPNLNGLRSDAYNVYGAMCQ